MNIYAIGDLHLSGNVNKPMDIFGAKWENHKEKIKKNWVKKIKNEDLVLIPGDISWAMKYEDAKSDLKFIDKLPGKKVIIKGNHDFWWGSVQKLNDSYKTIDFVQNNSFTYNDITICGTRGWICPNETKFTEHDAKMYKRESNRLKNSLESNSKNNKVIVMLHYPPTNDRKEESKFTKLIEKYNVLKVVYGHLHTEEYFSTSIQGKFNGVDYELVSADYINFSPIKIL